MSNHWKTVKTTLGSWAIQKKVGGWPGLWLSFNKPWRHPKSLSSPADPSVQNRLDTESQCLVRERFKELRENSLVVDSAIILIFLCPNYWGYALITEVTFLAKCSLFLQTSAPALSGIIFSPLSNNHCLSNNPLPMFWCVYGDWGGNRVCPGYLS